jgi:hypothetical protein
MDAVLDYARDAVDAPIDFQGQQLAGKLNYILLSLFGVCPLHNATSLHGRDILILLFSSPLLSQESLLKASTTVFTSFQPELSSQCWSLFHHGLSITETPSNGYQEGK